VTAIPTKPDFQSPALTVDQLAELLNVSSKTVYRRVLEGKIPGATKLGGIYRIHGPTVLAWLAKGQTRVSPRRHK
jgi:excisionase family DNA binding protein